MNNKVEELQEQINFLEQRINMLEKSENRRKAFKTLRIIVKIIIICLIIYALWMAYDYITHGIPDIINEKIQNVLKFKW